MISRGARHARLLVALVVLTATAVVELALLPAARAAASGCSREPGTPTDYAENGLPGCAGVGDNCYYCEYPNPGGGYTVCSEYPDPADGTHCTDVPILPGHRPQNQTH